jgi:hypothetical protein
MIILPRHVRPFIASTGARDILGENQLRRSRLTRRSLLSLSVVLSAKLCAQSSAGGLASRGVKPLPRGKLSGIPFQTRFVDVAEKAGLRHRFNIASVPDTNALSSTFGKALFQGPRRHYRRTRSDLR